MGKNKSYEEIHAKLAAAMQEACVKDEAGPYQAPTDDLSFLYEEKNKKKEKRIKLDRFTKVAAIVVIMLLGMNLVMLAAGSNESYSEKGLLHRIFEGTRGIFTDDEGTEFVKQDEMGETCEITDMSQINVAMKFWPDLYVPQYIPEGYELKSLTVTKDYNNVYNAIYLFDNNGISLEIVAYSNKTGKYTSNTKGKTYEYIDRIINIYSNEANDCMIADVYFDSNYVSIRGQVSEKDLLHIALNLN